MNLNFTSTMYLLLRLSPLLVVLMIVMSSFLFGDLRGFAYVIGLALTVLVPTVLFGAPATGLGASSAACNLFTVQGIAIGGGGALSQLVLGFSFTYLLYSTTKFNIFRPAQNLYLFIVFPALILFDLMFSTNNKCLQLSQLLTSLAYGGGAGVTWSWLLQTSGLSKLAFFESDGQIPHCSQPSKQTFKCRMYRAGKLIG